MSEAFRARLRRLRRDPGGSDDDGARAGGVERAEAPSANADQEPREVPGEPTAPAGGPLPDWLRARMARGVWSPGAGPERTLDPPRGLTVSESGVAARVASLERGRRHGAWSLDAALSVPGSELSLLGQDPALAALDPGRAVYLDIETTGLSGGSGTWPYMVALGRFVDGGGFELWQGFMRGPEEERALLGEVADRVADAGQLVTFFGKSFDRHRLEDKMRVQGVQPPFEGLPHLDLYHACRRLYGSAYADGRLATMEHELCGVVRPDDLPGSQAPAAYFDYLAGRPHALEAVFQHNFDDVLSLVTLTAHLGRVRSESDADGNELAGDAACRAAGLARIFERAKDRVEQRRWLQRLADRLDDASGEPRARACALELARLEERLGSVELALEQHAVLACGRDSVAAQACVRVALLEERAGRLDEALDAVERGRQLVERHVTGSLARRLDEDLTRRVERLEVKLGRTSPERS